jgi:phosphate transport system substrate-binding protein
MRNGISTAFAEKVFHGGDKWNEDLYEFEIVKKDDGTIVWAEEQMPAAIAEDRYGIGYNGAQYDDPNIRMIAIAPGNSFDYVMPSRETVQNRSYPLTRAMYMHLVSHPGQPLDPKIEEFVRYILSREGQEDVVRSGVFLPLTAEVLNAQLKKLEK